MVKHANCAFWIEKKTVDRLILINVNHEQLSSYERLWYNKPDINSFMAFLVIVKGDTIQKCK